MCREVQEIKKIQTPLSLPKAPKWNSASKYSPNFHRTENIVSCVFANMKSLGMCTEVTELC